MPAKYNTIGLGYNQTRRPDPYLASRLYHHLNPQKGNVYLDIGCGTGNYTDAIYKKGVDFIGVDPSSEMLEKAQLTNKDILWKIGRAESVPLENESVDGIMGSLTLHHWSDLGMGFRELYRVLRPFGRVVFFTATPKQMKGYWLNHYFPKMLMDSIVQMPAHTVLEKQLKNARFKIIKRERYFIKNDLQDLFLYAGKNRPELYLNEQVRNGISSFSALANIREVELGLENLRADMESGEINSIIKKYKNNEGDYLYIIAEKE